MSFCSGLWVPFMFLPKVVREIALALPPYHLSQLALEADARDAETDHGESCEYLPVRGARFVASGAHDPQLLGTLAAGSLPFSAMGLAVGYFTGPNSAPATIGAS
jgi:hypothetical protein